MAKSLEPKTLDLYAGAYEFPDLGGFRVSVTRTGNKLYGTGPNQPPLELLPLSASRFFAPTGYDFYQLDFVPDAAAGKTYSLVLTMNGMSVTGRRK